MDEQEALDLMLRALIAEQPAYRNLPISETYAAKKKMFRALVNTRPPVAADDSFLQMQDAFLQEEARSKGIVSLTDMRQADRRLYLWRGDITHLAVDAIVNAANSAMLGCFVPCHGCIDNQIHTYAGVQLRIACEALMRAQGHAEPGGTAKITPAFNLPSRYILHTVGPIIRTEPTAAQRAQLASCYASCLHLAARHGLSSVAFCCISTGEYRFPPAPAAAIAVGAVRDFLREEKSEMKVVFNVFTERDERIYERLLGLH